MIRKYRIPTKPSIPERIYGYMETSWVPTILIYACVAGLVIAANWSNK